MISIDSTKADKVAISLSVLCALHCLLTPVLLVMLPALTTVLSDTEFYHQLMIAFVVPTSVYAFTLGCKKHQRYPLLILGALGLGLLIFAAFWGDALFGRAGEVGLTLIGSIILASGHFINFRLCRACGHCDE